MREKLLSLPVSSLTPADLAYLAPNPLDVLLISHPENYVLRRNEKKVPTLRKIFNEVKLDEFEIIKLNELRQEIMRENIALPEEWADPDLLKICYAGGFKPHVCLKLLKDHLDWIRNPRFHSLTTESVEYLKSGIIYTFGTDKKLRPILVLNVDRIDMKKVRLEDLLSAFCFLLDSVRKNMFVPGKIENWLIIIDINFMSLFNVPLKLLGQVISCMSNNYPYTMEKLYIMNPSRSLSMTWTVIEAMMDAETTQKIKFLKKEAFFELLEYIDPSQLELKYGGALPNLTEYWPPFNLHSKPVEPPKMENVNELLRPSSDEFLGTYSVIVQEKENVNVRLRNSQFSHFSYESSKYQSFLPMEGHSPSIMSSLRKKDVFYSAVEGHYSNSVRESVNEVKPEIRTLGSNDDINDSSCACKCTLV